MSFTSYQFLIFFPVVTLVYYLIPVRVRYLWLLAASYYFYMCWSPRYALLMAASTMVTWVSGVLISRTDSLAARRLWVGLSFGLNLAVLGIFKYFNFFLGSITALMGWLGISPAIPTLDVLLPVGISFYTFQALSYTMDVYRGDVVPERNPLRYALFVSFFPQLVAGPIERSSHLLTQLQNPRPFDYLRARRGLLRMGYGLFLKLCISDRIAVAVDTVFRSPGEYAGLSVAVAAAAVLFTVQIYCDFGGYSAIAIGAAEVYGVELMENFRQPFFARTIQEFWRRWHISLSSWFRDYLYIPLGGSRKGIRRTGWNIMIVFLVSGLWHGAGWTFVIWGGLHGLYQVIGRRTLPGRKRLSAALGLRRDGLPARLWQTVFTFALVVLAFVFFRADSVGDALVLLGSLLHGWGSGMPSLGLSSAEWMAAIASILVLVGMDLLQERMDLWTWVEQQRLPVRWCVYYALLFGVLIFGVYGPGYDASAFIYFQF